jgi:hypothetical protein
MNDARRRTVAHMRQLIAAATILGGANAATACGHKDKPPPPKDAGDDDAGPLEAGADADAVDADATAESTLDSAVFAGPDAAKKRADAGKVPKVPNHGYTVVDPLPRPTSLPQKNCDPPFTYDANGNKHYKPECLKP